MSGTLYVVGTPIGNLGDLSPRAVEILGSVDFIAAEDTRVTVKLLNRFGIKCPLVSYFEHNKYEKGDIITDRILKGENAAIVTDAGMPSISDPGEMLVRDALKLGIKVESVPGPTAFATALSISGMSSGRFCFEGFLPVDKKQRKERLLETAGETRTLIFYEAPHKLLKTLDDMFKAYGNREIAICKELTKIHETVIKTDLSNAPSLFEGQEIKGEFVLIVDGAKKEKEVFTLEDGVKSAEMLIEKGFSASYAAKQAAAETGIKKSEIYKQIINLKK